MRNRRRRFEALVHDLKPFPTIATATLNNKWYQCNLTSMPEELQEKFVQLEADNDTLVFLEQSEDKSDWIFTQIWHSLAKAVLSLFMTQTSINGWLQRGSMFVVSFQQLLKLILGPTWTTSPQWSSDSLLDLGAGDGEVTARFASAFQHVYVTEVSPTMQTLLKRRGFQLLDIDKWSSHRKYDMISCLNLLDRCDKPIELLGDIHSALNPGGLVLLALVLPFSPYVESGSADHKPQQLMPIKGRGFEDQVTSFVANVLTPAGFEVVRWSRVPYLCEGDLRQSYYWLDDSIFILRARS